MDYSNVCEVLEVLFDKQVNSYLSRKDERWVLIGVAAGQDEFHYPLIKYALGKLKSDSDAPEDK